MLARTYFGHDILACYSSRQSQSGVGLRTIHHRNLLRIPLSWLLGEVSLGDGGRRASPSCTVHLSGCGVQRSVVDRGIFCSLPFKVNAP